ncbi:MAG: Hsp20/alpha crystallin family protein [Sedimentisphaerales bacterium]|nr:Hsp20/alpha crystallin family protein [Sedimentisphaerales bacterium]
MFPILRNNNLARRLRFGEPLGSWARLMEDFLDDLRPWEPPVQGRLDLYEDDKNLYVEAELPGFQREEIDVTLEERLLQLGAEHKQEQEQKKENYYLQERSHGRWFRTVQLPANVQTDKVQASFQDGVLKITLEKQAQKQTRRIEVK